MNWRVGKKVPLNVYDGDRPVCQCHSVEDALRIVDSVNDSADLDRLFELQYTRVAIATNRWREATGQHNVLPDLGNLVDWMLSEMDRLNQENTELRKTVNERLLRDRERLLRERQRVL